MFQLEQQPLPLLPHRNLPQHLCDGRTNQASYLTVERCSRWLPQRTPTPHVAALVNLVLVFVLANHGPGLAAQEIPVL